MLLKSVDELGEILHLAFNTSSGLPNRSVKVAKYWPYLYISSVR
jgi:hypothetical protein